MTIESLLNIDWNFNSAKTAYLTHGLHPYPAKYIPQIPHALIKELSNPGDIVADIFCGSGTTLVEANLLDRNTIGIDANPLAALISQAKTTRFQYGDIEALTLAVKKAQNLANDIRSLPEEKIFVSKAYRPSNKAISFWFEPFVIEELAEILSWCNSMPTKSSRQVALTAFSSIVVSVSKQDSDTRYVRREKSLQAGDIFAKFANTLSKAILSVSEFSSQAKAEISCRIFHSDILSTPNVGEFELMVCSPPYPNAYSYHLYHMTRMIWLGMDYLDFKKREIGSHRKYSKVGASIDTFRDEMALIFEWLYSHLKTRGFACFVIGDSTIRGQKINNTELLSEIAYKTGFIEITRLSRILQTTKKAFNPVIGKIKDERILILQKGG